MNWCGYTLRYHGAETDHEHQMPPLMQKLHLHAQYTVALSIFHIERIHGFGDGDVEETLAIH